MADGGTSGGTYARVAGLWVEIEEVELERLSRAFTNDVAPVAYNEIDLSPGLPTSPLLVPTPERGLTPMEAT